MAKRAKRSAPLIDGTEQVLQNSTIVTLSLNLLRKAGIRKYDAALRTIGRCYGEDVPTVPMFVERHTGASGVYTCRFRHGTITHEVRVPSSCFIKVVLPQELQRVVPQGRDIKPQRFPAGVSKHRARLPKEERGTLRL